MAEKTQLTSVKILTDLYKSFKIHTITDGITLQKLVNRTMDLYNKDENFKNKVDNHQTIGVNNSKF